MYRLMNTPLFPAWRSALAARGRRVRQLQCAAEVENEFARFLPAHLLQRTTEGAGSRERLYSRQRTFWCFLWQVMQPQTSCRAVVRQVQATEETARVLIDESSSAYCQARARLPLEVLNTALEHSARCVDRVAATGVPGWSRPVKAVDATSVQMPDTQANRHRYHYPTGQKPGCGIPVLRAVALFSLAGGALHDVVTDACYTAELVMFKSLWPRLQRGDILLGDRAYGCFPLLAALPLQGVDVVARLHQGRQLDLRRARKLGPDDWLTTFRRGYVIPPYLTAAAWRALPQDIEVRIIRSVFAQPGFRTRTIWIVTTLTDATAYPAKAIAELYAQRWQLELSFRDLKTTMGMESLRCRTPDMVEKELRMFLIAYNGLRGLMAEAAATHQVSRLRISFKGTVDAVRSFHPVMLRARSSRTFNQLRARLLSILVADALPLRPGRCEPRAVKKRPKPYPLLTKRRRHFREVPHRGAPKPRKRPQIILT